MAKKFNIPAETAQTIADVLTVSPEWAPIYTAGEYHRNAKDWIKVSPAIEYVQLYGNKAEEYKGRRADYLSKNPAELDKIIDWIIGK